MKLFFIVLCVVISISVGIGNGVSIAEINEHRISDPSVATQGFLPFVASVHNGPTFLCAGVIISVNWIVTSANCVYRFSPTIDILKVKVGGVKHDGPEPGRYEILVNNVAANPGFTVGNLQDNIALLHLERNIVFNDFVQAASLAIPAKPIDMTQPAIVAGWGSPGGAVTILEYNIYFQMIDLATCEAIVGLLIPNALCTTNMYPHPYACTMDVGGPLLQFDSVLGMVLYGITSFATCSALPTVYESIVAHRVWIFTVTGV